MTAEFSKSARRQDGKLRVRVPGEAAAGAGDFIRPCSRAIVAITVQSGSVSYRSLPILRKCHRSRY